MIFNTKRQATLGQLAALYNNPRLTPEQVDSNLFLNASQGRGYVQEQAANLGIGDPAQFFADQQRQAQLSNTPSGAQMEAARQAGQFSPQSLPGQLVTRDKMWSGVQAGQQQQATQLASLQQSATERAYPLPELGAEPTLTPLMQQEAARQGQTPTAFVLNQRLGANRQTQGGQNWVGPQSQGVNAEEIYSHPKFQEAIQRSPQKAASVFEAITGQPLAAYHAAYQKNQLAQTDYQTKQLRTDLETGKMAYDDSGNLVSRHLVPSTDPTKPGMVLSNEYQPQSEFQKSQFTPAIVRAALGKDASRFFALKAKGGSPVASLQNGGLSKMPPEITPEAFQTGDTPLMNNLAGLTGEFGRALTGGQLAMYGGQGAGDFLPPQGSAPIHAAPMLRNNPRFLQLMRTDPAAARRLILAIQSQGANKTPIPAYVPPYPAL